MLVDIVADAVREAGKIAIARQNDVGHIKFKSPTDFVTQVDIDIERFIKDQVRSRFSDVAFLGEEGGLDGSGRYLVVLDPIDATTNYAKGIPLFDIAASIHLNGNLVSGIVDCPGIGEFYTAEKGNGAFLNGNRINVSNAQNLNEAVVSWNRSYHPKHIIEPSIRVISAILQNALSIRILGTGALDYCFLAKGRFDAAITPFAEPYHSAGYIVMEEAGAKVTDYEGQPHSLTSKTLIAANPALHQKVVNMVQQALSKNPS